MTRDWLTIAEDADGKPLVQRDLENPEYYWVRDPLMAAMLDERAPCWLDKTLTGERGSWIPFCVEGTDAIAEFESWIEAYMDGTGPRNDAHWNTADLGVLGEWISTWGDEGDE